MDWQGQLDDNQHFLHEQVTQLDHKITRLKNARASCEDCLEAEGLDRLLHAAHLEEHILVELLARLSGEDAPPLDGLILAETAHYQTQARRAGDNWRRGHTTPPAYWDAEAGQGILTDLLRRLHAWRAGRPVYPETDHAARARQNGSGQAGRRPDIAGETDIHPWYSAAPAEQPAEGPASGANHGSIEALEAMRARMYTALHHAGFPDGHVELVVQADGAVIATGYAHDDEQAEQALEVLTEFPGVWQVVADIQVVSPQHCPACRALEESRTHIQRERWHGRDQPEADAS